MNIIFAFLIFIFCIALGHFLLGRKAWGSPSTSSADAKAEHPFAQFIDQLGGSATLILIAPTSAMLFWGWSAGFLWLSLSTLFTGLMIAYCLANNRVDHLANKEDLFAYGSIALTLKQIILVLFIGLGCAILTQLIQLQTGIWFVLLGSLLAVKFVKNNQQIPTFIRAFICLIILVSSILLGTHIGVSFFGDWHPIPAIEILRFDNSSLTALGILSLAFYISSQPNIHSALFKSSGALWLVFFFFLIFSLLILLPELEAPMHNLELSETNSAPPFIAICAFLCAPFLLTFLAGSSSQGKAHNASSSFAQHHIIALSVIAIVLLFTLALASGTGIGSWKTHFLYWPESINLIDQFKLALNGLEGSFDILPFSQNIYIFSTFILSFCALIFLVGCLNQINAIDQELPEPLKVRVKQFKLVRTIIIALVCLTTLEYGFSLALWLIVGMLCWNMICSLLLSAFNTPSEKLDILSASNPHPLYVGLCLALSVFAHLSALVFAIHYLLNGGYVIAAAALLISGIFIKLQWLNIKSGISELSKSKQIKLNQ